MKSKPSQTGQWAEQQRIAQKKDQKKKPAKQKQMEQGGSDKYQCAPPTRERGKAK